MVASLRRPPGSAAAAEGALQHATARLPTDRGPPRRPRSLGSKFPPQILPPAHTRPLTPGKRSPVNGIKSCSARADRMRPILSRLASHAPQTRVETPPQMLPQPLLGANAFRACEDLLDEMDIKEDQFDANTGNLRSSAQITAQTDPRSTSDASDPICPRTALYAPCRHHVHVYVCRNEAFLQLRMAVRVLRVAVRVLGVALYFNSTVTFFLFLRGLGGTPFEVRRMMQRLYGRGDRPARRGRRSDGDPIFRRAW